MRIGKTAVVHFGSQVVLSVSGFLATFAIARLLGAEVLGVYAAALALTFWVNIPASAVGSAITKRVSEGTERGAFLSAGFLLNLGFALVLGVIVAGVLVALDQTAMFEGSAIQELTTAWWLVGPLVSGTILFSTVVSGLEGQKRVGQSGILKAAERVLRTAIQVVLILAGATLLGIIAGHVVALVVAGAVGLLMYESRLSLPTRRHARSLASYAQYAWLGTLQTRTFGWMDTIVLAVFVQSALVGIYDVAWNIASLFALLSGSIRHTLFPEMSDVSMDGDYERIHHYLDEALAFAGLLIVPGLFGAAVLGDRILKIYRPEFVQGAMVLVILVLARALAVFGEQLLNAINAIDRPDVAFRINLGFVAVNMTLNVVLVWQFGWYGAAVATTVSAGLLLVLSYRSLAALVGRPSVPVGEIGRQVFAGSAMAGIVLTIRQVAPQNHYATISMVAVGIAVYGVMILVLSTRVREKTRGLVRSMTAA